MRHLWRAATFVFLAAAATAATAATAASAVADPPREINPPAAGTNSALALVGATLIDGRGGPPVADAVVIIRGERIHAVGTRNSTRIPPGAEVFDATGRTLVPGLLDSHFHIERDYELPPLVLSRGVTSVRDPGQWIEVYEPVRRSTAPQPRCFVAGPHLDCPPHAYPRDAFTVTNADATRRAVNRFVDEGASVIKVYYRLPLEWIAVACTTAHQRGVPVTAHLELVDADDAIRAGLDGIEHVTSFGTALAEPEDAERFRKSVAADNEARRKGRYELWSRLDLRTSTRVRPLIDQIVRQGVFLSATLAVFERRRGDPGTTEVEARGFGNMLEFVRLCHRSGVRLVVGSHSSVPGAERGWAYQRELELLAECGLAPIEIITAATRNNAGFFRVSDRLGTLESGKLADVVLIDGDPSKDIRAMRRVGRVMLNGRWHAGPGLPAVTLPAGNATVNTRIVFVEWTGLPHTRYQVRVTRANDPDSAVAWDSGEVASDRNFAWTGAIPDGAGYHAFVRVGHSAGWGPWSAEGRGFRVDTASVPDGANVVRVSGRSLCDNSGPFLGLGATYFQALRRTKHDRSRLTNDLALLASKGFNYVRVLSMVNWDGLEIAPVSFVNSAGHPVKGWPDYAQQFRDMLDIIGAHGLRAEVTIFADAQHVMPSKAARQAHLRLILAAIAGREHRIVHLEVANEAWQNGFPGRTGVSDLREFAKYLADRTTVPVAITSNDDTGDAGIVSLHAGSAADLATVHFSRDRGSIEGGWLPVRDCYRAGNLPGVPPVTSNEPIGPGSSVSSENDPIHLCAAAVFAYIANLPAYVYHSRAGVSGWMKCCPPSGGEARFEDTEGINAYRHLRAILPGDLASWVRNDGLEPGAPFTVFCNGKANTYWPAVAGPTNGCNRNIGAAKGAEFVSFPMGILGGGVTLQARSALKFQVYNPLTGVVVSSATMNTGDTITLPRGPGACVLKGSFRETGSPRADD